MSYINFQCVSVILLFDIISSRNNLPSVKMILYFTVQLNIKLKIIVHFRISSTDCCHDLKSAMKMCSFKIKVQGIL